VSTKLDLVKAFPDYYRAKATPATVTFGPLPYLIITGRGEPEGVVYTAALGALYRVAYGVKKLCKAVDNDFVVPKLEGQWWVDETETLPALAVPRDRWNWRLLLRLPEFVTETHVEEATKAATRHTETAQQVRFETLDEGTCVQVLHHGPYSSEPETLEKLEHFIEREGFSYSGLHHEIYLTDPRKSAPEKLRTILRQPVLPQPVR
jgi:hypothetical protein